MYWATGQQLATLISPLVVLSAHLELVKLQHLVDLNQLLHLFHLPHLCVALFYNLRTDRDGEKERDKDRQREEGE